MKVFGDEQQLCPCYNYKEYQEFQKLVELKDSGLVVYCHRPRKEDYTEMVFVVITNVTLAVRRYEEQHRSIVEQCFTTHPHRGLMTTVPTFRPPTAVDRGMINIFKHAKMIRQAEAVESKVNTSKDVFILYNKKNVKKTSFELKLELEKENLRCPRCLKTFVHAQELMQEVKSIDSNMVMGVCDHCRKNAQGSKKLFCACDKIVKKFISAKGVQKEDTKKYFNTLPLKMGHLRTDTMVNKENHNAYSDFQINRGLYSPASRHEPEVQKIYSHTHFKSDDTELSETSLKEGYVKQDVAFIQPIEPVKTFSAQISHDSENINTIISGTSLADSETTFLEPPLRLKKLPRPSLKDRKQEEIFEDRPSIDAKEALKRRHDLSLRQMMRPEKDSVVPYYVSKIPDTYETPKIAPWVHIESTSKYRDESEIDMKIPTLKHNRGPRGTLDLDYLSNRVVKFRSTRASQHSYIEPRKAGKYHHDNIKQELYSSEEGPKKVKELENPYIAGNELKLQRSVEKISHKAKKLEQHLAKSKSGPIETLGNVLEHQYSYFFPKMIEKDEKKGKLDVTSSQLIKDTQEKLRLQAERENKRQEKERQNKFKQAQKKKLAREEKRLQTEEKIQAIEEQNKHEKKQRKLEEEQRKYQEEQRKLEEGQKTLPEHKKYSEKDLESKSVAKEKKQHKPRSYKSKDEDEEIISESKVKPEKKGNYDVTEKGSKDLKSTTEQKNKMNKVSKKAKTNFEQVDKEDRDEKPQREKIDSGKFEQVYKDVAKKQKTKPEKEARDEKLQKRLRYAQAAKDRGDALSKKGKVSRKIRDASDKIKVSISKIQKTLKNETSGNQEAIKIKQGKRKKIESKTFNKESPISSELQKAQLGKAKEEAERETNSDELKRRRIKMQKVCSGKKLKLVKIKQAARMRPSDINSEVLRIHKCNHQHSGKKSSFCQLCVDSGLELEFLSTDSKKKFTTDKTDIIIGEKIFKYKPGLEKIIEPEGVPMLFQKEFCVESDQQLKKIVQTIPQEANPEQKQIIISKTEMEPGKGALRYALSDRTFIDKGWTMLPTEKIVRKMNVYRMRPAHPEFDWFEHNKSKRLMTYDTGERLAEFDDNGRGRWYYRNGRLALDYYDAEETNAHQRFVIYSSGEPDERGRTHPITILATFDHLGNGIVFDHTGKIRLKYNQTEGVVLDRGIGPVSHWKWHSLNDPPVLQQVMIDTHMAHKGLNILELGSAAESKIRPDNEEMLAIEFDNFIREKSKKLSQKFKPFQIRMKALKINEHFSLKVLDQATVYLIFRDGVTNLKLNIGMILDHQEIVDTDTAEVGEVSNSLERFPARTDSLTGLQRSVAHAQRYERQHAERERRLRPAEPCASADHLTAAASPPMRLPLITVPTGSSSSTGYCSRKPTNNIYYDTRLRC